MGGVVMFEIQQGGNPDTTKPWTKLGRKGQAANGGFMLGSCDSIEALPGLGYETDEWGVGQTHRLDGGRGSRQPRWKELCVMGPR